MDAQLKSILKWILLLPASFAASMLAFAIGSLIGYISTRMFVFGGDGRWIWSISRVIANVLAGYAFVYTGAQMAPKHKLNIAIILAALLLVMLTVGITLQLVFQFASGLWEQIEVYLGSIMAFIGALTGYKSVKSKTYNNSQITNKTILIKRKEQATLWHHTFGLGDKISLKMEEGGTCIGEITALDVQHKLYVVTFEDEVSLMPVEEPESGWVDNHSPHKTHKLSESEYMLIANRKLIGTTLHYHF